MCAGVYVLVNVHMHALGVFVSVCVYVCTYIITISTRVFTHHPRRVKDFIHTMAEARNHTSNLIISDTELFLAVFNQT